MANNNKRYQSEWNRGDGSGFWAAVVVILIIIAVAGYVFWPDDSGPPLNTATEQAGPESSSPSPAEEPDPEPEPEGPRYPVAEPDRAGTPSESPAAGTEAGKAEPATSDSGETDDAVDSASEPASSTDQLPSLDNSDQPLRESLESTVSPSRFEEFFIPESLIRHFVVTIDNMTRAKLPEKYDFTQPPPGSFRVKQITPADSAEVPRYRIDPANFERYERYVVMAETVSLDKMVAIYQRYYPLFQSAYEELGYPDRYFNDRFVEVIDHLLATPDVDRPVELVQPKVFYQFAEQRLEDMSAGRKLMIRIGPDNAARIKARLRDLRQHLTSLEAQL